MTHDLPCIVNIATRWPQAQPGETFIERQLGAMLKARIDKAKKDGTAPTLVAKAIRRWVVMDVGALENGGSLVPGVVTSG